MVEKKVRDEVSHETRRQWISSQDSELSLTEQASLAGISRSSLYYRPVGISEEEIRLRHRIDEIYTQYAFYGSRKMAITLQKEGFAVGRKRVQTAMREMGIEGIHPGPNLSKRDLQHRIYPYLPRNVVPRAPHHVWGIDVTYIRLLHGWMYLVATIDWFSRYVVSWELDHSLEIPFVLDCVDRALSFATPTIWNSDQGSHFTSPSYLERLKSKNVQISMDGKGRALDNVFTERLWRSLKYEEVVRHEAVPVIVRP